MAPQIYNYRLNIKPRLSCPSFPWTRLTRRMPSSPLHRRPATALVGCSGSLLITLKLLYRRRTKSWRPISRRTLGSGIGSCTFSSRNVQMKTFKICLNVGTMFMQYASNTVQQVSPQLWISFIWEEDQVYPTSLTSSFNYVAQDIASGEPLP